MAKNQRRDFISVSVDVEPVQPREHIAYHKQNVLETSRSKGLETDVMSFVVLLKHVFSTLLSALIKMLHELLQNIFKQLPESDMSCDVERPAVCTYPQNTWEGFSARIHPDIT